MLHRPVHDYHLKPIDPEELRLALVRYDQIQWKPPTRKQWQKVTGRIYPELKIRVNTYTGFNLVHPDEIINLQAEKNYTEICLDRDKLLEFCIPVHKIRELERNI